MNCKLAIDGKNGKPGSLSQPGIDAGLGLVQSGNVHGDGMMQQFPCVVPGGIGPYSGFLGALQGLPSMVGHHHLYSSFAGTGLTSQIPGSLTGAAGYANNGAAAGFAVPYSGGPVSLGFSGSGGGTGAGSGALTGGSRLLSGAPAPGW